MGVFGPGEAEDVECEGRITARDTRRSGRT